MGLMHVAVRLGSGNLLVVSCRAAQEAERLADLMRALEQPTSSAGPLADEPAQHRTLKKRGKGPR
jgi:hypothetical protein